MYYVVSGEYLVFCIAFWVVGIT